MNTKNQTPPEHEDAEQRLLQGIAMVLSALPELIWGWIIQSTPKK